MLNKYLKNTGLKKLSHFTPLWRLGSYSSYSFSTSALDGGEWSASRPGRALAPGKGPRAPIVQEAGWALEPVWTQRIEEKSFRICRGSNLDRPFAQPVARHFTDRATWLILIGLKGNQIIRLHALVSFRPWCRG
jgi:hypothetical protein